MSDFARKYHDLRKHTWYTNINPSIDWLVKQPNLANATVIDYSCGTGIFTEGLLQLRSPGRIIGVDASAKFLSFYQQQFASHGAEYIHLKPVNRTVPLLSEVAPELIGQVDYLVCANAIHLYPNQSAVLNDWLRLLKNGGSLHIQSGNVVVDSSQICIDTVAERMHRLLHPKLDKLANFQKVFPAPHSLDYYQGLFAGLGVDVVSYQHRIPVITEEWLTFLDTYWEHIAQGASWDEYQVARAAMVQELGAEFTATWCYFEVTK